VAGAFVPVDAAAIPPALLAVRVLLNKQKNTKKTHKKHKKKQKKTHP
jgi:hypothetical protein